MLLSALFFYTYLLVTIDTTLSPNPNPPLMKSNKIALQPFVFLFIFCFHFNLK